MIAKYNITPKPVAVNKDRYEGSMRMMGEKAHKALNDWWSWIDGYLEEGEADGRD